LRKEASARADTGIETKKTPTVAALSDGFESMRFALEAGRMFAWERGIGTGRFICSASAEAVIGIINSTVVGFDARVHPEDIDRVRAAAGVAVSDGKPYEAEFRFHHPNGSIVWLREVGRVVADGGTTRFMGVSWDITPRKATEEALRKSEERLAMALDSGSDGLWDWTVDTGATWYSDHWQTMLGYEPGELPYHISTWERLIHPDDKAHTMRQTFEHFEGRSAAYESEFRMRTKVGGWAWILSRGKVVTRGADGRPLRIVGTHIDIEARKSAERQIAHLATHDPLTNLPNRALFHQRLDEALSAHGGTDRLLAVLCLDLDRFKAVNDTFGHVFGDSLLREVARRLNTRVGAGDVVARLGGDEFAVLRIAERGGTEALRGFAEDLIETIGLPIVIDGQKANVGLSVGVALAPPEGTAAETLFKYADLALYRAKKDGRETFRFFEPVMLAEADERRRLEAALRCALANGEFTLHYQPFVDVKTGLVTGFEALARWRHPERGTVSPQIFIPLAEETGIIVALGEWVLRTACAEASTWPSDLRVAINVSPVQLQRGFLAESVVSALAASGLPARRLELEVTESALLQAEEHVTRALNGLRGLGAQIAIDDFGTGYSSLGYLCEFPVDRIKIDRSFVRRLSDPKAAAVVQAIIGLGRQLGMAVTAEGIEIPEQLETLRRAGCAEAQGFLFSHPRPVSDLGKMIAGCWAARPRGEG
jgi:diguanylate cyclase (GGDEF)-like protein/PAS domain S-box-containing protein